MTNSHNSNTENKKENEITPQKDNLVETKHAIIVDGIEIPYTVTCGTIVLKEEAEKKGENGETPTGWGGADGLPCG